jgi:fructose transport system ATP-binding protein
LDRADFDLYSGEVLGVIGDNGAGKTTMIKAISGALVPDEGEIRLDGKAIQYRSPMEARDAGIETVYQNLALSPALSIADNMFLGREIRKPGILGKYFRMLDRAAMERSAREKLSELGLLTVQNIGQAVETLSGGQRQGVAVAVRFQGHHHGRTHRRTRCQGVTTCAGSHPGCALTWASDSIDLPQYAPCL